ncbi:MAG: thymidylate kinase [Candidatus Komeilibacteria bacterium]
MTGKLIVIDGTDGSGKATQVELLAERLKKDGYKVAIADFPRHGEPSAYFVQEYLNGRFGPLETIGPKKGSIFYALDRYAASFPMRQQLEQGYIVLSNRYVTANMGHQGGKIADPEARHKFFDWLYELEFEIVGIPKPDLNIILHVPAEIGQQLVDRKSSRDYIGGKKRDLHEQDINHLKAAEQVYLEIAKKYPNFALIECVDNGMIMSREKINDLIWETIEKCLNTNP